MSKFVMVLCLSVLTLGICGCGSAQQADAPKSVAASDAKAQGTAFQRVSSDEAAKMMAAEQGYLIVDVRTAKEYADGHIPHAINIPNESIGGAAPKELPDKNQKIFVYCRSGARSVQASEKLAGLGYTNIEEALINSAASSLGIFYARTSSTNPPHSSAMRPVCLLVRTKICINLRGFILSAISES